MKYLILVCLLAVALPSCKQAPISESVEKAAILAVMAKQESDWNNGNLEAFMQSYWKSEQLAFVGKTNVTRGWQQTLERYQKSYPDKAAMGKLSFEVVQLEPVSANVYHMIGKYNLEVGDQRPSGHFTLLWKKVNGKWLITLDHSS